MKLNSKRLTFLIKFRKTIPFTKDFFTSNDVGLAKKSFFSILLVGYLLFPFDIIPDFLLWLGFVDDIAVGLFLVRLMMKMAPESLKRKHNL